MNEPVFPDDASGDALRNMLKSGSDFSKLHEIDFHIVVPDEQAGNAIGEAASQAGYHVKLFHDDEFGVWTCECTLSMLPTYDGITQIEKELEELAKPFGGYPDGWGTFSVK